MRSAAILVITLVAAAQGISPDEVRVKSQNYVAPGANTLRVDTNLVEVGVVVRDAHGHTVGGLTKGNFRLEDNGKDREIEHFAVDSSAPVDVPQSPATDGRGAAAAETRSATGKQAPAPVRGRFIALYFDDVNAKDGPDAGDLKQTQDAAEKFLKAALQPGVEIGIFTASGTPRLDFTTDEAKLIETVKGLEPHVRLSENACVTPFAAYMMVVQHNMSALTLPQNGNMDVNTRQCQLAGRGAFRQQNADPGAEAQEVWKRTVDLSRRTLESIGEVADHLGQMNGSRVLLLASSGFITATIENERDRLIQRALHDGVVINALDSKGLPEWAPPHTREYRLQGRDAVVAAGLERSRFETVSITLRVDALNESPAALAEATGGEFFHNNNDLHRGFEQLAAPPEVTYRLSFQLHDVPADGTYHKLKVSLENVKSATVQSRPGYFAPEKSAQENASAKFDREVTGTDVLEEIPMTLEGELGKGSKGVIPVTVFVKVDISKMELAEQRGRRTGKIRVVSALRDSSGAIVSAKEATMELALKQETYDRLAKSGLTARLTLEVAPGSYQLREVVEDGAGKMACSTNPIDVK